jgi:hypothetical protein
MKIANLLAAMFIAHAACCAGAPESLEVRAALWTYKSLCDFADPPRSFSATLYYPQGGTISMKVSACPDLEREYGQPTAVAVTLKNTTQDELKVPAEGFDAPVLATQDGKTFPALPLRRKVVPGPLGSTMTTFVREETKPAYSIMLKPGQEVDLVFLFSSAKPGDTIRFGNHKPAIIK